MLGRRRRPRGRGSATLRRRAARDGAPERLRARRRAAAGSAGLRSPTRRRSPSTPRQASPRGGTPARAPRAVACWCSPQPTLCRCPAGSTRSSRHIEAGRTPGAVGSKVIAEDGTIEHAGLVLGDDRIPYRIYQGAAATAPHVNRHRIMPAVTARGHDHQPGPLRRGRRLRRDARRRAGRRRPLPAPEGAWASDRLLPCRGDPRTASLDPRDRRRLPALRSGLRRSMVADHVPIRRRDRQGRRVRRRRGGEPLVAAAPSGGPEPRWSAGDRVDRPFPRRRRLHGGGDRRRRRRSMRLACASSSTR